MENKLQKGFLTLADISGYTSFVASTELEHSQEIMHEFLQIIINQLTKVFDLAEIEGDAVFVYASEDKFPRKETFLELIERTYYEFVKTKELMNAGTTCSCNACRSIPNLDLKFISHYGRYIFQNVTDDIKPMGNDVIIAHRLLKNGLTGKTGWNGYAMLSESCLKALKLTDENYIKLTENYEHIGDVITYSYDLHNILENYYRQDEVRISEDKFDYYLSYFYKDISAAQLWSWINEPEKREFWMKGTRWTSGKRKNGRTQTGSVNHCAHGKNYSGKAYEYIIDWKPFDYYTAKQGSSPFFITISQKFIDKDNGVELQTFIKLNIPAPKWLRKKMLGRILNKTMNFEKGLVEIESLIRDYNKKALQETA